MVTGKLYIISAPSGAGKTSLVAALLDSLSDIQVSVSHTTRKQRPGEENGVHYHFLEIDRFEKMLADNAFLEYAKVFDNYYGTAHSGIQEKLEQGIDVILEIDWQGAQQVRKHMPEAIGIFIIPPSRAALQDRLRGRGQDDEETIARRMCDAVNETSHYSEYDFIVVNDEFELALADLRSIFIAHRLRSDSMIERHTGLIADLLA